MLPKGNKLQYIFVELAHHLPFSIFGVTMGLIFMGVLTFFAVLLGAEKMLPTASRELFHIFHPAHVLLSSVTTTAMFWKHEKRMFKALIVGFAGSVGICGLSDIIFPFFGGLLMGAPMQMHVCIIQEPGLVFPFAIIGVLAGFFVVTAIERSTEYSHSAHVFVSSAASLLYMLAFGLEGWTDMAGGVFLVTVIAVMIPCCLSDIAFPILCVHRNCDHD